MKRNRGTPADAQLKEDILVYMRSRSMAFCLLDLQQQFSDRAGIVEHAVVELLEDGLIQYHEWSAKNYVTGCVVPARGMVQGRLW